VQNFTSQGVDAIIVNPVDTAATAKITDDAQKAHIPLVYVNRRPDGDQLPPGVGYVGSDEVKAGEMQMRYLADKMGGKGNLAIMLGLLSNNATHTRTLGGKDRAQGLPQHPRGGRTDRRLAAQQGHGPDEQLDCVREENRRRGGQR